MKQKSALWIIAIIALIACVIPASATNYYTVPHPFYPSAYISQGSMDAACQAKYFQNSYNYAFSWFNHDINGGLIASGTAIYSGQVGSTAEADTEIHAQCNPYASGNSAQMGIFYNSLVVSQANITFVITETGSYSTKLANVSVSISNGQSGITNSSGMVTIGVTPNSSAYTYTLTKTGYATTTGALGGYGETGGTIYLTMTGGSSGSTRTYCQNVDTSGAHIANSDIFMKNNAEGTWQNWTNRFDGTGYIDTPSTSTIKCIGQASGFSSATRDNLTAGNYVYELALIPAGSLLDPGPGNVNLVIIVNDRTTAAAISSASVSATTPSGSVQGSSTSSAGTVTMVVPNMSLIRVSASKTGYDPVSQTVTTTAFGPDTIRLELNKATVTVAPTSTVVPGESTVRPTYIAGCEPGGDPKLCATNQDSTLWGKLRSNGSGLLDLFIAATFIGGLFLIIKSMKT